MFNMFGKKSISNEIKHLEMDLTALELHLIELQASREAINLKINYLKDKEAAKVIVGYPEINYR